MKAEVNVPRTWAYVVLVALLLGSGMFAFAMAYNANYGTTPNPASNAITFGHSPDEIEVDLGTGTAPCTGKVTLQFAIANKCLGGGGSGGGSGGISVSIKSSTFTHCDIGGNWGWREQTSSCDEGSVKL